MALRAIAILLLLGVFIRHDTAFRLSELTGVAPADVFYLQGGALEVILCAVLLFVFMAYKRSVWIDLARTAAVIGIVEGAMLTGCSFLLTGDPPSGVTKCDHLAGFSIGAVIVAMQIGALLAIVGYWTGKWWREWRGNNGDGA